MADSLEGPAPTHDISPHDDELLVEVVKGLGTRPKTLQPKMLYDKRGSELFDKITQLDDYYPTRTEISILETNARDIARAIGRGALLIEFGSGSSTKTERVLEVADDLVGYAPIDISKEHLEESAHRIHERFPSLDIFPICADFMRDVHLPDDAPADARRVVFFPGSTIGNMHRNDAAALLSRIAKLVGKGGGLIIGVDLKKDRATLERAYNDSEGVTAEFNLNMLDRFNRELDSDFDRGAFEFRAEYNAEVGRVESYLISQKAQKVSLNGETIDFDDKERILTECSYKYDPKEFATLAATAGLTVADIWTDPKPWYSLQHLTVEG